MVIVAPFVRLEGKLGKARARDGHLCADFEKTLRESNRFLFLHE